MTPMLLSWHISMVACHGSQEERRKLWMNTWTDLNKLCENAHDCDLRNSPPPPSPRSIDNYLGPRIYHDANQRPSQLKKCEGAQFPAVPQSVAHLGWTCSYMQECFSAEEGILPAGTAMSKCSEGQTNTVPTFGLHGRSSAVTIHRGGLCQAASNRHLRVGDPTSSLCA